MAGPTARNPAVAKVMRVKRLVNSGRHGANGVAAEQHVEAAKAAAEFVYHLGAEVMRPANQEMPGSMPERWLDNRLRRNPRIHPG